MFEWMDSVGWIFASWFHQLENGIEPGMKKGYLRTCANDEDVDAAYAFDNHWNIDCCFAKATCSLHALPSLKCRFRLQDSSQHAVLFLSSASDMHTSRRDCGRKFWIFTGFSSVAWHNGSARHKELVLQVLYKDLATNATHRRASYVVEAALNNCSPQDGGKMEKQGGWDDSLTVMNAFPQ